MTALRQAGAIVRSTAGLSDGFPDVIVGYRGLTVLMEIKLPQSAFVKGGAGGKRARQRDEYDPWFGFTPDEIAFHTVWNGQPIAIVHSIDEALAVIGL